MTVEHITTFNPIDIIEAGVRCAECKAVTVIPLTGTEPHKALMRPTNCVCGAVLWRGPNYDDEAWREMLLAIQAARRQSGTEAVSLRVDCGG